MAQGLSFEQFKAAAADPDLFGVRARYNGLPDSVRSIVSETEYAWLSDAEKARLQQDLTEPDAEV